MIPLFIYFMMINASINAHVSQDMFLIGVDEMQTVDVYVEVGINQLKNITLNFSSGECVELLTNGTHIGTLDAGERSRDYKIIFKGKKVGECKVRYETRGRWVDEDNIEHEIMDWGEIDVNVIERGRIVAHFNWPPVELERNETYDFNITLENVGKTDTKIAGVSILVGGNATLIMDNKENTSFRVNEVVAPGSKKVLNLKLKTHGYGEIVIKVDFSKDANSLAGKNYFMSVKEISAKPTVEIISPSPTRTMPTATKEVAIPTRIISTPEHGEYSIERAVYVYAVMFCVALIIGFVVDKLTSKTS